MEGILIANESNAKLGQDGVANSNLTANTHPNVPTSFLEFGRSVIFIRRPLHHKLAHNVRQWQVPLTFHQRQQQQRLNGQLPADLHQHKLAHTCRQLKPAHTCHRRQQRRPQLQRLNGQLLADHHKLAHICHQHNLAHTFHQNEPLNEFLNETYSFNLFLQYVWSQ